jgi:hypothetical protein
MKAQTGESVLRPTRFVLAEMNTADLVAAGLLGDNGVEADRAFDVAQMREQALIKFGVSQKANSVPPNWRGLREGQPIHAYDYVDYGGLL